MSEFALPLPVLAVLRHGADAADQAQQLTPEQITVIHQQQWLRMLVPKTLGGLELPLPAAVRIEEAVSQADGSCGWVVTLCAGAGWFAGFLPVQLSRGIFATPSVCLAGSGAPTGFASKDGDGWLLHGDWSHASGSQIATHVTLNAQLLDGGLPLLDARGQPLVRAFVVPADCVKVDTQSWQSIGLRASTSRAFSIDGVRAEAMQVFDIAPAAAVQASPLYRFPFMSLALVTLAACMAGMARHFMELAQPLVARRLPQLDGSCAGAIAAWQDGRQAIGTARADFYALLEQGWEMVTRGDAMTDHGERDLNDAAHALARVCREAVDAVYPYCGLRAADTRTELNRVWRDVHTASQHSLWLRHETRQQLMPPSGKSRTH